MRLVVIDKDIKSVRLTVDEDEVRLKFPLGVPEEAKADIHGMAMDFVQWLMEHPQRKTLRGIVFYDRGSCLCYLFDNTQMGKGHTEWTLRLAWRPSYGIYIEEKE